MLRTCENYAAEHNLKFSTNDNPAKCKTKCIAFQLHEQPLSNVELCGVPLPWVEGGLHLGNTLSNKVNGMGQDIRKKRAAFISKNNELNQEFCSVTPLPRFLSTSSTISTSLEVQHGIYSAKMQKCWRILGILQSE